MFGKKNDQNSFAREIAKRESEEAKKAKELAARAKRASDAAAKERFRLEAMAAKEQAKRERDEARKAKQAALQAKREKKAAEREIARQKSEEAKKIKQEALLAKRQEKEAAKAKALRKRERARQARETAILSARSERAAAREQARLQKEEARIEREAVLMVKKEEALARERSKLHIEAPVAAAAAVAGNGTSRKKVYRIVPLFSLRSIVTLGIGLIVGASLGLGYWMISPSLSSSSTTPGTESGGGSEAILGVDLPVNEDGPFSSSVDIQVISPGSTFTTVKELQYYGEFFAARSTSIPYLTYVSEQLEKDAPEYYHDPVELKGMIESKYDWDATSPVFTITVTGNSAREALFLARYISNSFEGFMDAQDKAEQEKLYADTLAQIEGVKSAILEAQTEYEALKATIEKNGLDNDPQYIALNIKASALENEMERQSVALANVIVGGGVTSSESFQSEIQATLDELKDVQSQLNQAENNLKTLEIKRTTSENAAAAARYLVLDAKITALEMELDRLMTGDAQTTGLTAMIIAGQEGTEDYEKLVEAINSTSEELVKAKQELAVVESELQTSSNAELDLEYQLAQAQVDNLQLQLSTVKQRLISLTVDSLDSKTKSEIQESFGKTSVALAEAREELKDYENQHAVSTVENDLELRIASAKLASLNDEMGRLTLQLSSIGSGSQGSGPSLADYWVAGYPSSPVAVLPERIRGRDALMMGALFGVGGAWLMLNFKWLTRGMGGGSNDEVEEEETA